MKRLGAYFVLFIAANSIVYGSDICRLASDSSDCGLTRSSETSDDVYEVEYALPTTPMAKKSRDLFGSGSLSLNDEVALMKQVRNNTEMNQRSLSLGKKALSQADRESLELDRKKRALEELQHKKYAGIYCICGFLGLLLLCDTPKSSIICATSMCLPVKSKMT